MADVTITNLPNATTPLSGTERVPMDQSGVTRDASTQAIADLAGAAITAAVAAHAAAADPHPTYLTQAEGDALYEPLGGGGGGGGSGTTNLSIANRGATTLDVASDTGTDATIPAATTSLSGLMANADKAKLDGIASGATANATNAELRDRSTHTGTQASSTISDFDASSRAQVEATLVAGANITLTPSGSGASRTIAIASTAAGGGGGTVTNVTGTAPIQVASGTTTPVVSIVAATTSVPGSMSAADKTKLDGIAAGATANASDAQLRDRSTHTGTQAANTITGLGGAALLSVGTTAGTVAAGDDARLSDARTPTAHNQAWSTITSTPTTLAGYGITDAQPLDSDLTAIAALSTTSFGRSFLALADAAAARTAVGLGVAVVSDVTGITGADRIVNMVSLTQAEYDAITPDASTFYVIL